MRILLAIDGSEFSEAAVDEIARWQFPAESEVRVISVVDLPTFPITVPWAGVDFDDQSQKIARGFSSAAVEKAVAKHTRAMRAANLTSQRKSCLVRPSASSLREPKHSALI